MRSFGTSGYLLSEARLEVRLVYSGFLLLACIGFLTMAAFQLRHVGPTPERVATYFRGGLRGMEMAFPKTARELVELTHFHAFIMGLVYLVLAHLFLATKAPERVKRAGVVVTFAGLAGDLVGVWLIVYVSALFAWLQVGCWLAQWAGFAAFVYYPLREMWFRDGRQALPPE
ncbi:MAG: hypothetical protein ACRD2T_10375 [Thermoanaerobaculia bacterium]